MPKPSLSVLVASDSAEEIKLITRTLRNSYPGCHVEAVYSAEEALDSATRDEWPIILLDEQLPRQCGLDILPELKRRVPRSAIILQAERNDSDVAVHAMRTGADYYIWKKSSTYLLDLPIAVREVLEKLDLRTRLDLANERYRRLIENMTDLVYELDHEGRFVYVSETAASLVGYGPTELIGTHFTKLVHPDDTAKAIHRFNERRTGSRGTRNLELRLLHKDGAEGANRTVEVEVNAVGLHGPHNRFLGTVGVVQNVEKRKREETRLQQLSERLQHTERLKELGQFIAGIAHELNNPLTSICGYTDLILGQITEPRLVSQLKTVASEAARAAQIVKELLVFARPQATQRVPISVEQIVNRVCALKGQELAAHGIHVEIRVTDKIPPVLCDETQLQQVLLNLLTNAQHAMWDKDHGGRLLIAAQSSVSVEGKALVDIEVIDSGPGVPPEDRRRIFTPFYTKKKNGQGTGLGLAIVERLIQENGGSIEVDDAPGGGARFRFRLPASDRFSATENPAPSGGTPTAPSPTSPPPSGGTAGTPVGPTGQPVESRTAATPAQPPGNGPHVVVVEDERSIRYLISTVLTQEGYRVTVCENGHQGIQQVRQALELAGPDRSHDPAVILSDFQMPGMNGRDFFSALKKLDGELIRRLVFITGDTMNSEISHLIAQTGNNALAKPFTPAQLVQIVRRAVAARVWPTENRREGEPPASPAERSQPSPYQTGVPLRNLVRETRPGL